MDRACGSPFLCRGARIIAQGATILNRSLLMGAICASLPIHKNKRIHGVTLTGGEPFEQVEGVFELAQLLKAEGYDLWIYSGYLFEDLMAGHPHEKAPDLLALCDVLVDGPFVEALHSYDLNWAGSSNQRVIDLPATLKSGEVVLWKQDTIDFEAPSSW